MAKPCEICGDIGAVDAIITCCKCKSAREHIYCMRVVKEEAPLFWICEECIKNKLVSPTGSNKEHKHEASTITVSGLIQKSPLVTEGPNKRSSASRFNFKEKRIDKGRTKYISCAEAVKLSSGGKKPENSSTAAFHSTHGSPKSKQPQKERISKLDLQQFVVPESIGREGENAMQSIQSPRSFERVQRTNIEREIKKAKSEALPPQNEEADVSRHIEVPKSSKNLEKPNSKAGTQTGDTNLADVAVGTADAQKPNLASYVPLSEMHSSYIPAFHSCWKGSFNLPKGLESFNDAFKAHPPSSVHIKVYKTLMKMPKNILFELVPNHEIWMEIFPDYYCPDKDDIGLYFFPSFKYRSENSSISLMDFLWNNKLVMKSYVDGVELLVLSSRLLQAHSQEFKGNHFLWGVFRRTKVTKNGVQGRVVSDTRPVLERKHGPSCDVPPGFERTRKPQGRRYFPPGFEKFQKP